MDLAVMGKRIVWGWGHNFSMDRVIVGTALINDVWENVN